MQRLLLGDIATNAQMDGQLKKPHSCIRDFAVFINHPAELGTPGFVAHFIRFRKIIYNCRFCY